MGSGIFRDDLLSGKVALVTGGGTGIGAAIARELGALGADLAIASRTEERIARAGRGLSAELGRSVLALPCDIRDPEAVARTIDGVLERFGRLDIVVNNGGGQFFAPAASITPGGFEAVVRTNLIGTWLVTRTAADRYLFEHGGKVISITMLTGRAFPGMAHSVAARAGVEAMTRTLAVEWAEHGITLNCVAPGYIASSGLRRYPVEPSWFDALQATIPLKRLGRPEEIAHAVAFLASPAGDYITGQVLTVDGGKTLWGDYWQIPDPEPLPPVEISEAPWEREEAMEAAAPAEEPPGEGHKTGARRGGSGSSGGPGDGGPPAR